MSGWDDFWKNISQWKGLGADPNSGLNTGQEEIRQNVAGTPTKSSSIFNKIQPPRSQNSTVEYVDPIKAKFDQGNQPFVFGRDTPKSSAPQEIPTAPAPNNSSVQLEGYLREIQDRLAQSKATAPTINLDTKPIDSARESSVAALAQALDVVMKSTETARGRTTQAYGDAKAETQGAYNAIEDRSRVEGKAAAKESGRNTSDELAKSASVAMAGINQDSTDADAMMKQASNNLGGSNAALREIQGNVDPNNSADTVRNNIAQTYQDRAGNAANQTGRDIQASNRMADTIGTDGAGAIANLMSELAGRNNQYDRDIQAAQTSNAGNVASLESGYADKIMQAQLAQQQEQNAVNNTAWQTNTANDSNALNGMLDLFGQENSASLESAKIAQEAAASQQSNADRSKSDQLEILLKGLVSNTDKNSLNPEDIQQLLAAIQ